MGMTAAHKLKRELDRAYRWNISGVYPGDICAIDKHIECARLLSKAKTELPDFEKWIKAKGWSKKKMDALLALVEFDDPD